MIYRFGNFILDDEAYELRCSGKICHTEPLVFDLIRFLVTSGGRIVSRDELVDAVWHGRIVSEATIASCIKSARHVLGDSGSEQSYIRTVRGRGIQLVKAVENAYLLEQKLTSQPASETADEASDLPDLAGPPSIAVLPLTLLTPSEKYSSLGDAVSQEVIVELSRLHWLFVTNRGSSFKFRSTDQDLRSISNVLSVRYVLSGTLTIHDQTSVVSVELSQGASGRIIWAERFEQPVVELLLLRSAIAGNIVRAIESRIQSTEAIEAGRLNTENLDAWSAYHRGLWHMFRFNERDSAAAAGFFTQAVTQDPQFARAHAGLSFTHFQSAFLNFATDRREEMRLARAFAEKSNELDPLDPFVNLTMGRADWLEGEPERAISWFERAIEFSPNYAFAIYNHALMNVLQGESMESADKIEKAIALSPIDPLNYAMLSTRAMSDMVRGDFEAAVSWMSRATAAPNAHFQIFVIAAIAYECSGRHAEAEKAIAQLRRTKPDFKASDFFRAFPFAESDFLARAQQALGRLGVM